MFFETCPFSLNQMFAHCTYQPGLRVDAERERIRGEASSSTGGEGEGRQGEVGGEHQCCHCWHLLLPGLTELPRSEPWSTSMQTTTRREWWTGFIHSLIVWGKLLAFKFNFKHLFNSLLEALKTGTAFSRDQKRKRAARPAGGKHLSRQGEAQKKLFFYASPKW